MQEREVKNIDFKFDEDSEGKVSAVFSVFNNLDSDGDIVLPGSIKSGFRSGDVPMVWAHKWDMPIGKGYIREDGDKATFVGEFFMDTDSGQEAYKLVKNMGDLQQWSFGYRVNDSEFGKHKDMKSEEEVDARFLKDLTVFEVSPVLVGANQDTYTLSIKSNNDLLKEIAEEGKASVGKDKFDNPGEAMERAKEMGCDGIHSIDEDGKTIYMPCKTHEAYEDTMNGEDADDMKEAKTHTEQHAAMEALGNITEEMKEILAAIPKDEDADLPQWWVDMLREIAEKMKVAKDNLVEPKPEKVLEQVYEDPAKALAEAEAEGKSITIVESEGKSYYKVSESVEEETQDNVSFSQQVKDVLAAFNDLMARATAIAMLRAKDGRKLGMKATDALRAVQEDLQDAWSEVDEFITEFGAIDNATVEELETEVEESADEEASAEEEVEAEATEESVDAVEVIEPEVIEEEESEEEVEEELAPATADTEEEVSTVAEEEITDDESDALWAEGQALIAESLEADLIEE
jgi:HK97 family phage prohead protease